MCCTWMFHVIKDAVVFDSKIYTTNTFLHNNNKDFNASAVYTFLCGCGFQFNVNIKNTSEKILTIYASFAKGTEAQAVMFRYILFINQEK